jgi:hypothetical protein
MILVLGILSLVCCNLLGPVAWIMGKGDLAKIRAGEISQEAEGMTKIGMILGIVGTVLLILSLIGSCIYVVVVVLILGAAGASVKKVALDVIQAVAILMC